MEVEPRNNQPDKGKMFTKGKGSKITNADIMAVGMIKKKSRCYLLARYLPPLGATESCKLAL